MARRHATAARRWPGARRLRAWTLAILALAALAVRAEPAEADILWGVNGHPFEAYRGIPVEQQLDLLVRLGVRSYRVDVTAYDRLAGLEALTAAARARGLQILPILLPPLDIEHDSLAVLHDKAFAFAHEAARRLKGVVPVWELGNEMENWAILRPCDPMDDGRQYPCNWGPAGGIGPLDYRGDRIERIAAVLKGLSDGLSSADPAARSAIGSAGWGHLAYFDRLAQAGVHWDISVWHMYGEDPEWAFRHLAGFGKPIWVTEFNHPFGSMKDGEAGQRDGLVRWMRRLQALAPTYRVEAAFVYELLDESYWGASPEASMGLVHLDRAKAGWSIGATKAAFAGVRDTLGPARPPGP